MAGIQKSGFFGVESNRDEQATNTSVPILTGGNANYDLFSNVQPDDYWSATEYAPNTSNAWVFDMIDGDQNNGGDKSNSNYAWAVHSGDVRAVPLPGAVWLFGSGLLGLVGMARRK